MRAWGCGHVCLNLCLLLRIAICEILVLLDVYIWFDFCFLIASFGFSVEVESLDLGSLCLK